MARFYRRPRRFTPRPRRRLDITAPISASAAAPLIAEGRPPEVDSGKRRPWAWIAAAALHALVIVLLLISWRARPPQSQSPPGISVVFDNGGEQQTTAPPAPHQAVSEQAQSPPPMPLPPAPAPLAPTPPQLAEQQPEVNLDMPEEAVPLPQTMTPQLQPPPLPKTQARPVTRPRPSQKYVVMNDMSLTGGPPAPATHFKHGINLDLPQSWQSNDGPEVTVHGDVGADWDAELDQWVEDHKYYPQAAAEQGQQGDVQIHFIVDRRGNVTGLKLIGSSGSVFLDQAWLGLFHDAQLPPFPMGTKSDNVAIDATMHYELIP